MAAGVNSLCRDCLWRGEGRHGRCPACASPRVLVHAELFTLAIAHIDCDAFYASVEKRDRPELRDQPVIVGGGVRGVVTTACYVARTFGVRSAMPMFQARKLCPDAVVLRPDFVKYRAESRRVMQRLQALTPLVQPLSLDEAWLDLSGTERLHAAPPAATLARAQAEIERDIGLGVSVGLAPNKFLAKIASDFDKPRGFKVVGRAEAETFLAPLPVRALPGVGPVFVRQLADAGYVKVADLASAEAGTLARKFGDHGLRLSALAHGRDSRLVNPDDDRKTISAETTFDTDLHRIDELEDVLWPLCEKVARRARGAELAGKVVSLKLRGADFRILTRRRTLTYAAQTARTLFHESRDMLRGEVGDRRWRLIGVGLSGLTSEGESELAFLPGAEARALASEKTVDRLRARFGEGALTTGRNLRRADSN